MFGRVEGHANNPDNTPRICPVFSPLEKSPWGTPLMAIKVTRIEAGGTVLGVNINHACADAASCINFVKSWGRAHRGMPYRIPSNERWSASVNGTELGLICFTHINTEYTV